MAATRRHFFCFLSTIPFKMLSDNSTSILQAIITQQPTQSYARINFLHPGEFQRMTAGREKSPQSIRLMQDFVINKANASANPEQYAKSF